MVGDPEDERVHKQNHDAFLNGAKFHNKVEPEAILWNSLDDKDLIILIKATQKGTLAAKVSLLGV